LVNHAAINAASVYAIIHAINIVPNVVERNAYTIKLTRATIAAGIIGHLVINCATTANIITKNKAATKIKFIIKILLSSYS
jgi:hypothetical protein